MTAHAHYDENVCENPLTSFADIFVVVGVSGHFKRHDAVAILR